MIPLALGIDIGGTKTAVGVVDPSGRLITRADAPTPARAGGDAIVANAVALARSLMADHVVAAAGVGSAGVVDVARRRITSATDHLSDWAGTELGSLLESALGVPVTTDNDVHAHAIGEAFVGAGAGMATVLLAAIGTGIGGAVVVDGRVQTGAHSAAGHLGHVPVDEARGLRCPCGKVGHLEAISSGHALHELYRRLGGSTDALTSHQVVARVQEDPIARAAVTTSAWALGHALGGLVNMIDPDVVVIAGGMRNAGPLWWSCMTDALRESAMPLLEAVPLVPAKLGDNAAIIGAAKRALDSAKEDT